MTWVRLACWLALVVVRRWYGMGKTLTLSSSMMRLRWVVVNIHYKLEAGHGGGSSLLGKGVRPNDFRLTQPC